MSLISHETRRLLEERWNTLPEYLKTANQVVGRHWVQCAFTMGPSYCSFGCSHCYLPRNANRVPIVPLKDMKAQIRANRKLIGPGGGIQITGGDVVDAYWRAERKDELVEIIRYTVSQGLVPMLMTHGQILLDHPDYFRKLIIEGGLRKISCHIDITQAGRSGYPVKSLHDEAQLNPLRDRLVALIMRLRKETGCLVTAAQTVTVTSYNIDSIGKILNWIITKPENMDVTRTISFQTEAEVGRTLDRDQRVIPEKVWDVICDSIGYDLPKDHLLFGHPDCSSTATVIARSKDRKIVPVCSAHAEIRRFWERLLEDFGGVGARKQGQFYSWMIKAGLLVTRPRFVLESFRFIRILAKQHGLTAGMLLSVIRGEAKGFNIVMHNFMGVEQVRNASHCQTTRDRLDACSFRGAIEKDGEWIAVPMCEVNANIRPKLYNDATSITKTIRNLTDS